MAGSAWTNQVQNQVIIAGTVPGVLAYNPSIGAGNLVASISGSQTADASGNEVLATVTTYSKAAGAFIATQLGNPSQGGIVVTSATTEAGPYSQLGDLIVTQGGVMFLDANGNLRLSAGQSGTGSLQMQTAGGSVWSPSMMQVDISTNGPGNTNTATDITTAWPIPGGDAVTGTTYTIKALLTVTTGQTTIETLTVGADIGGVKTPLATLGAAFNGGALATTYAVPLELMMTVDAVTAGTPEVYLNAPLGDTSANRLATNSANLQGFSHAASFAAASGGTFAAYAQWGGAGGSQQLAQTISSRLYREGP